MKKQYLFLDFRTRIDTFVSVCYLLGIVIFVINIFLVDGNASYVLLGVNLALYMPLLILSSVRLRRTLKNIKRLDFDIRVREIILETFSPDLYKEIVEKRQLDKMFRAKSGKAEK